MIDRLALYNRISVFALPGVMFLTSCFVLLGSGLKGGFGRASELSWSFGQDRALPFAALLGAVIVVLDCALPKRRKSVFAAAIILGALASAVGWSLAALALEL